LSGVCHPCGWTSGAALVENLLALFEHVANGAHPVRCELLLRPEACFSKFDPAGLPFGSRSGAVPLWA
jgi:hypothetical protein